MGVQPPGRGGPIQPPEEPNAIGALGKDLSKAIGAFVTEVRDVLNRPSNVDNPDAIGRVADAVLALNKPSMEAANLK